MVYGIDLGTTYSAIAKLDGNNLPQIIENFFEDGSTPLLASAVYFPDGGEPVVGEEAKNHSEVEADKVVQFVKRQIGRPDAKTWSFDGVTYDPVSISAIILKRMKEYAEAQGEVVESVVIACPAHFGDEEREATKEAGRRAGLHVLDLVNEPTAAALSYCSREYQQNRKILVYDLGGGTFDVTLLDFSVTGEGDDRSASVRVIDSKGNSELGGIDWDNLLYDHIALKYADEVGYSSVKEIDPFLRQIIRSEVEATKKALSKLPNKAVRIAHAGDITSIMVTRDEFEKLTKSKVMETMVFVDQLLTETDTKPENIDVVLLVGSSTKMPMIENAVKVRFPGPGQVKVEDPDKAVAKGAAIAATISLIEVLSEISRKMQAGEDVSDRIAPLGDLVPQDAEGIQDIIDDMMRGIPGKITSFWDILPYSFGPGVMVNNEYKINNLLFKGGTAPAAASETYRTREDNLESITMRVFKNTSNDEFIDPYIDADRKTVNTACGVEYMGELELPLAPNTPKNSPIETTFHISNGGLLDVTVKDPTTGSEKRDSLKALLS